jgi:hypothetical protein
MVETYSFPTQSERKDRTAFTCGSNARFYKSGRAGGGPSRPSCRPSLRSPCGMQFDLSRASVWGHFCFDIELEGDLFGLLVAHALAAEDCCAPNFQVTSWHNSVLQIHGRAHNDVMIQNVCARILRPCHPRITASRVSCRNKGAFSNQSALTHPNFVDESTKLASIQGQTLNF